MKARSPSPPPLDPGFVPAARFNRQYRAALADRTDAVPLVLGLEREDRLVSRHETLVRRNADAATARYVERLVKFMLWAKGGWRLYVGGPAHLALLLSRVYAPRGPRGFDVRMMARVYGRPFEVRATTPQGVPPSRDADSAAGGKLRGCRIGFDLGASDHKIAAVRDGRVVFAEETPWDPANRRDPAYHYHHLSAALHRAAAHLPRVDAIGGSTAGIVVDNEIRVASLFRAVPPRARAAASGLFKRIAREWNTPVVVMNDGDVTALAGTLALGRRGMLGIAMGSSEAAGFIDRAGRTRGWLNELAFAPVDYSPAAPVDEWSGDRGVGALYFSQQTVGRLLPAVGIATPAGLGLPERLREVQRLMERGDERAARIYETIGCYLGWSMAHYADFYDYRNLLALGRVTTGPGGDILLRHARRVLRAEFPALAARISLHLPDEKSRRLGQAVAAASLPAHPNH